MKIYDPDKQPELVRKLTANAHNALVIGHSNTIPELARLLCHCGIGDMPETEHDRMIIIRLSHDRANPDISQGRIGN